MKALLAALACAAVLQPHAQPQDPPPPTRPRIALVLSGGGARGLAHIGVLKVLRDERVPIEYIVATSMGSIVGGAYAAGRTPEEMEAHTAAIPGPVTHRWIEGGRHELKGADATVGAIVAEWVAALTRH